MNDFDVIVIGAGGAGLSAAITAAEAGASVMLVEADSVLGGATRFSTGVVYAAGTSTQREAGIHDNATEMYNFLMTFNQHDVSPALMRYYSDHSADAVEWLKSLGVAFPVPMLISSCVSGVLRGHTPSGFALAIIEQLINRAGVLGVETAVGTRVSKLAVEKGRVCGIEVDGMSLRAGSVILATGGFGNNPAMVERLLPKAAYHGDRVWAVHRDAPYILGDGITLGESVGAAIVGQDHGLMLPSTCFPARNIEAFLPPWVVAVNQEGRRFMAEWSSYCVAGDLINAQTGHRCWAIFDHAAMVENNDDTHYTDPYDSGHVISSWETDSILGEVARGAVHSADSIEKLASLVDINPQALTATIAKYNQDAENGVDTLYLKEGGAKYVRPIVSGPYYAVEVRPAIIGFTAAGLDIDLDCRVLDNEGLPIIGLYAAGEVLGCYHGTRYGGGGMSVGGGIVFGRRAGRSAAHQAAVVSEDV